MPRAFDGTIVPRTLNTMPCGGTPRFDDDSGYAYRCDACFAVIGSIGQPKDCVEFNEKEGYVAETPEQQQRTYRDNRFS